MSLYICVYTSSSDAVDDYYKTEAFNLGKMVAEHGHTLVYGGTSVGLMKAAAEGAKSIDGRVIGVIPSVIKKKNIECKTCDDLIVTKDMRARKATMENKSDAFIALPGGFGTLEEIFEIITLKQLQEHNKAIVFINSSGYYDKLADFLENMYELKFAKAKYKKNYFFAKNNKEAIEYIEKYVPPEPISKWFQ